MIAKVKVVVKPPNGFKMLFLHIRICSFSHFLNFICPINEVKEKCDHSFI